MQVRDLERLFDYGYWANRRLFTVLETVTPVQFTQPVAGSYGSLRNTLVHVMSAEWGWLERCGGPARGSRLVGEDYPTLASVRAAWERVERMMRDFLAGLREEDMRRPVCFSVTPGSEQTMLLADLLEHSAIHAVHHRGQVALLLRALGVTPGNFDFVLYAEEAP